MKVEIIGVEEESFMKIGDVKVEQYHGQDCCEHVYAEFSDLKDTTVIEHIKMYYKTRGEKPTVSSVAKNIEQFEHGFKIFGYFVPCYDIQNGYYSNELNIIVTQKDKRETIQLDGEQFEFFEC